MHAVTPIKMRSVWYHIALLARTNGVKEERDGVEVFANVYLVEILEAI